MSFILDALKKSEIERQRQSEPGLMDTPAAQRRGRLPLWAILLGALLAINVVVLAVMLLRSGAARAASSSRPVPRDAVPADCRRHGTGGRGSLRVPPGTDTGISAPLIRAVYGRTPRSLDRDQRRRLQVATAVSSHRLPRRVLGTPHSIAQRSALRSARTALRPDPLLTDEDAKADNEEVLPSINEINLSGAQALPELHLDVHVYATKASERFVYINMRKYHEGNSLPEGPVVEHIRRDGVVVAELSGLALHIAAAIIIYDCQLSTSASQRVARSSGN